MFIQIALHLFHRQRAKPQHFAARDDGRQELLRRVGSQYQHHVGRGFLQCFEQGVGGVGVGFLKAQKECHAVATLVGLQHQALPDGADLFHLKGAAFFFCLDDGQVGVLHAFDLPASLAGTTGFPGRDRLRAVQGLSQTQTQGAAAQTGWPAEKIRMPDGIVREMLFEHLHRPFVSEQTPVIFHHSSPARNLKYESYRSGRTVPASTAARTAQPGSVLWLQLLNWQCATRGASSGK